LQTGKSFVANAVGVAVGKLVGNRVIATLLHPQSVSGSSIKPRSHLQLFIEMNGNEIWREFGGQYILICFLVRIFAPVSWFGRALSKLHNLAPM
jgi:hypothetical protein